METSRLETRMTREGYLERVSDGIRDKVDAATREALGPDSLACPTLQWSVSVNVNGNDQTNVRKPDSPGGKYNAEIHSTTGGGLHLAGLVARAMLEATFLANGLVTKSRDTVKRGKQWSASCQALGLIPRPGDEIIPEMDADGNLLVAKAKPRTAYSESCWPEKKFRKYCERVMREVGAFEHTRYHGPDGSLSSKANAAKPGAKMAPRQDLEHKPRKAKGSGTKAATFYGQAPDSPFSDRGVRVYTDEAGAPQGSVACVATLRKLGVPEDIISKAILVQRVKDGSAIKGDDAKPLTAKGKNKAPAKRQKMPEPDLHKPMNDGPTDADLDAIENEAPKLAAVK